MRLCGRPFKSLGEMNFELTRRWNAVIGRNDIVYYLGDFAMGDPEVCPKFCKRLNGTKILVRGNHDKGPERMHEIGFAEVHENIVVEVDGLRVWMNHYLIDNSLDRRGYRRPATPPPYDLALCGHVHEKWTVRDGCFNVGVDVWSFAPIRLSRIREALES